MQLVKHTPASDIKCTRVTFCGSTHEGVTSSLVAALVSANQPHAEVQMLISGRFVIVPRCQARTPDLPSGEHTANCIAVTIVWHLVAVCMYSMPSTQK
jgi:hypothetical protein